MTNAALRAHGFTPTLIVGLVGAGYTEAKPRAMRAGGVKRLRSCDSSSPAPAEELLAERSLCCRPNEVLSIPML